MAKAIPSLQGGTPDSVGDPAIFGVLTVSDRASTGIYDDESGPAILNFFHEALKSECVPKFVLVFPLLGMI
jgi:molybdopterin adenylyltransferase